MKKKKEKKEKKKKRVHVQPLMPPKQKRIKKRWA
jgi:hypothetical protein